VVIRKIKPMFADTKVRYGGSAALLTALVVAVLVVLNLVVSSFDWRIDLTANKLFSLSTQSQQLMQQLDKDVTIYALYRTGRQNQTVSEVINQYVKASDRIKFEIIDPLLNPMFVEKYKGGNVTPDLGSVIVASGEKFRVLQPTDFVNYTYSYYSYQPVVESIAIEQQLTSAIMYVTNDQDPVLYRLVGHNELSLTPNFADLVKRENYRVEDLDLLKVDAVPEDTAAILMLSPTKDLTEDEDQKLREYLKNGGRVVLFIGYAQTPRPVLEELLASYGLRVENRIVVEGSASSILTGNPFYLIPNYKTHALTNPMVSTGSLLILPGTLPITILQARRSTLKIDPLLVSSSYSWSKGFDAQIFDWEENDPIGPFNVAVAVTDGEEYGPKPAKLIVISTVKMLEDQFDQFSRGANSDFIINCINWLHEAQQSITVRPKPLKDTYLSITYMQQLILAGAFVVVLPVLVFLTGFVVWKRRRNL